MDTQCQFIRITSCPDWINIIVGMRLIVNAQTMVVFT